MFSVPFTLLILACPMPPIPTAAIFNLSLGDTCPWLIPRIELGAMVMPAKAIAPVLRKSLLEMSDIISYFKGLLFVVDYYVAIRIHFSYFFFVPGFVQAYVDHR